MKKGLLFLAFVTLGAMAFAQDITTITAVSNGDKVDVTITWKPADDWTQVYLRGNYDGDQWGGGKLMTKNDDGSFSLTITGKAIGETFEYKFFADDTWMDEAENYPVTVGNPFGGVNGFVTVDDGLLAGTLTKAFAPTMQAAFTWRPRVVAEDTYTGNLYANLKNVMWFKIGGEILPGLTVYTQFNALANSGDSEINLYNEASDPSLKIDIAELFWKGGDFGGANVAILTHFSLEYATDYVDIAYLDHYAKPIPDTMGANDGYLFRLVRNDPASGINALGGMFRLSKNLSLGDGIGLNYLLGWGSISRSNLGGWGANSVNWVTEFSFQYGAIAMAYLKTPVVDAMFQYYNSSADVTPHANNVDDYLSKLDHELSLGVKGSFAMGSWAAQMATQFSTRDPSPLLDWTVGRHMSLGAKVNLDLAEVGAPVTVFADVVLGGSDYRAFYNYNDFGWEDEAKGYNINQNLVRTLQFKVNPKATLDIITVGLDNTIKMLSPLYNQDDGAQAKNMFYNAKPYVTADLGNIDLGLMAKLFYNGWETVPADTAQFGISDIGFRFAMSDVVPGALNLLQLDYGMRLAGTTTTAVTTDDGMAHSVVLTAGLPMDMYAYVGVAMVTGEVVSSVTDAQDKVGFNLGFRQDIKIMGRAGSSLFIQYSQNFDLWDNDENAKLKMADDYVADRLSASGALSKYNKLVFGANLDF